MNIKLGISSRHFRIYDKLCTLSGLISAYGRESWVSLTVCLFALQDGEVPVITLTINCLGS